MKKFFLLILLISVIGLGYWLYHSYQNIGSKTSTNSINDQLNQTETTVSTNKAVDDDSQSQTISDNFSLIITNPVDGTIVNLSSLTITGRTAPFASVYINDGQLTADSNGNFSTKITLDEGENIVYVLAHDNIGDAAEKEITVTLESK